MEELKTRFNELQLNQTASVDELLYEWMTKTEKILDDVAPEEAYPMRRRNVPWMEEDILDLIKQWNKLQLPLGNRKAVSRQINMSY
jgi:hypothetical protein